MLSHTHTHTNLLLIPQVVGDGHHVQRTRFRSPTITGTQAVVINNYIIATIIVAVGATTATTTTTTSIVTIVRW